MTDSDADRLLRDLEHRIAREDRLVTAYSGGADSALLAAVAHQVLGSRALAVTAVSASLPAAERAAARDFARSRGLAHVEVCTDELDRPAYRRNGADRCFHCKSALFDAVAPVAAAMGARIALGTNLDDLSDHRPGQRAARDRGAVFPLVDAGLSKAAVRAVSRELGLATAAKPAAACLSSRIAYGDPVTPELLGRIEQAEDALHEAGFGGLPGPGARGGQRGPDRGATGGPPAAAGPARGDHRAGPGGRLRLRHRGPGRAAQRQHERAAAAVRGPPGGTGVSAAGAGRAGTGRPPARRCRSASPPSTWTGHGGRACRR